MSRLHGLALAVVAVLAAALAAAGPVRAAPAFPDLTGRVVDGADILSPAKEAELASDLERLEAGTGRQLVLVTLRSLQGYSIEDYGYQLGRSWGIGRAGVDDGALFIVAPAERKVRIEVGYGLEGVLTDALSSVILHSRVLPHFRDGDMAGGVEAGTRALIEQLSLDAPEAEARVARAQELQAGDGVHPLVVLIVVIVVLWLLRAQMRGRRRAGLWIPPVVIAGGRSGGYRGGSRSGGFRSSGGFRGGGGSFGGGGASGGW